MSVREAALVLADGEVFEGEAIGADRAVASGEVVFNTVLSGYQEVITDPSYAGQIITFTYPHIGNYGVNPADVESSRVRVAGFVNSVPEFHSQSQVINGASDVFIEVFGEAGRHTRMAVGVSALPYDVAVEVEAVFEVS